MDLRQLIEHISLLDGVIFRKDRKLEYRGKFFDYSCLPLEEALSEALIVFAEHKGYLNAMEQVQKTINQK